MNQAKRHLWKFIGASAGLHLAIGGLLFFTASMPLLPNQPVSVMQVSLVNSVEVEPFSAKARLPVKTSTILPVARPLQERMDADESSVDKISGILESPREEILQQPSLSGSDSLAVAATPYAPVTGNGSQSEELNRFLQDVRSRLEQAKQYPWLARIQGREGTVRIQFMIAPSGEVKNIHLVESSRSKILDDEAIATVKRVGRFSGPPVSSSEGIPIQVPLVFQLNSP